MNSNIFQFNRFIKLFVREYHQQTKTLIWFAILFAILPIFQFVLNWSNIGFQSTLSTRETFLSIFVVALGVFSPFIFFYTNNHPKKGLNDVMLPASTLEKYIEMQLFCILLIPIATFILYGGMDALLHLISPKIYEGMAITNFFDQNFVIDGLLVYLLATQISIFFNTLFVRRKILKGFGVFILIQILTTLLMGLAMGILDKLGYIESLKNSRHDIHFNIEGSLNLFDFNPSYHPVILTFQAFRVFLLVVLPIILIISSHYIMRNKKY